MGLIKSEVNGVFESEVYNFIKCFLEKKALNSPMTASDYESDIRQFFLVVKGKHLEMLTVDDLKLTVKVVEDYQVKLATNKTKDLRINKGETYSPNSIARKISAVKKLYNKLEANEYPVKEAWFKVDKIKGETKSYGVLEWSQVQQMMELVKDEIKGDVKSALLETAVVTCFRQNSLLNLTWDNLHKYDGVWVLCAEDDAIGKGMKVSKKPINDDLYKKLMDLKKKYGGEKIFPITKKTVVIMMQNLREKLDLDEDITFHSLKKCGINEAYELSGGDIMAVAEQGDHESFGTTMKHYMQKKKKFSNMIGLKIGQEVDIAPIEELTHEQLLDLVKKSSRSLHIELLNNLKKS